MEIPEGIFYKEINNYNIYVDHKDYDTGMLHGVTIYIFDGSNIEDATVTVADSAKISMAETGKHLKLTLWSGQQVGTFRQGTGNSYQQQQKKPYLYHLQNNRIDIVCKNKHPPLSLQMFSYYLAIIHTTKES